MKDPKEGSTARTFGTQGVEAVRAFVLGVSILAIIVIAAVIFFSRGAL